jgi:O-antigen/teichoic acid export membrane protein
MTIETHARSRRDIAVLRGFLWTSGGRLLVQVATWAISLVIARLLTPRDYGIAGMASLYVGFAQMLAELGFGAAIVQRSDISKQTVAALMGVSLVMSVGLAVVSVPAGYALAAFSREPILIAVVSVYGLNFIPAAIRSVSTALLSKDMAFHKVTILGLVETVTASVTSLVFALAGWSVWALVLGNTVAVCVAAALSLVWAHPGFSLEFARLRGTGVVTFGYKVLISRAVWYFYASTDYLIIGRRIGAQSLGHYNLAYQFASIPGDRITGALTQVLFPVFSTLQSDRAELARYFRHSTEACSLALMPVYVGLALVANDLIDVALGPKWHGAASILAVLSLAAVIRSLTSVANTVIVSCGNAGFLAKMSLIGLVVFPPAFFIASYVGAAAVAAVWLVLYPPVLAAPIVAVALRAANLTFADFWSSLKPAVAATLLMAAAAYGVNYAMQESPVLWRLSLTVITGAVTYVAVLMLVWRDRISRYIALASRGLSPAEQGS